MYYMEIKKTLLLVSMVLCSKFFKIKEIMGLEHCSTVTVAFLATAGGKYGYFMPILT